MVYEEVFPFASCAEELIAGIDRLILGMSLYFCRMK